MDASQCPRETKAEGRQNGLVVDSQSEIEQEVERQPCVRRVDLGHARDAACQMERMWAVIDQHDAKVSVVVLALVATVGEGVLV